MIEKKQSAVDTTPEYPNPILSETLNFFELFTDSSNDLCLICDKSLRIFYLNNKALEYSTMDTKEQIIGLAIQDLTPSVVETGLKEDYLRVLATGEPLLRETTETVPVGTKHFSVRAFKVDDYLAIVATDITELKEKEITSLNNLKKVEQYIDDTLDPFVALDASGKILFTNPALCRILNRGKDEIVDLNLVNFLHALDQPNMRSLLHEQSESSGTIWQLENRLIDLDGETHFIAWNINLQRTPSGDIEQLMLVGKDLTDLRKVEEKLILQANVIEQVHDAVITTDLEANIIAWNREAARKFGYSREDILGRNLTEILANDLTPMDRKRLEDILVLDSEIDTQRVFLKKDGTEFPGNIHFSALRDKDQERRGYIGVVTDLTQHNRMLNDLRLSEKRLTNAQRLAALGYFEWNIQNETFWMSDELYAIYQIKQSAKSLKANTLFKLAHADDKHLLEKTIMNSVKECTGFDIEYRIIDTKGNEKFVYEQVEIIPDEGGQALLMTGTIQDITQRKNAEKKILLYKNQLEEMIRERTQHIEELSKELIESSRKAGMAEVATGVLHNVGNVLNSINISVSMLSSNLDRLDSRSIHKVRNLLEENKNSPENFFDANGKGLQLIEYLQLLANDRENVHKTLYKELETIEQNVDHVKHIVRMQQSHANSKGIKEERRLSDLLEEAIVIADLSTSQPEILLKRDYDTGDLVDLETHKLLQILINLLTNAKDSVVASANNNKQICLSFKCMDPEIEISVEDNGVGMESSDPDKIFSMGYSTKPDGHGYGLHTSANLTAEIGGTIKVYSEGNNKGARFTLRFNRCQ